MNNLNISLKIYQQLDSLLNFCKELKLNQDHIVARQIKMQDQLLNIEKNICDTDNENRIQEALDSKFKNFESKVNSQSNFIKEQIYTYKDILEANKTKSDLTEKAITSINKGIQKLKIKIGDEDEAEKKKMEQKADNIVIFDIPESTNPNVEVAKRDDEIKLKKVIGPMCSMKNNHIAYILRKGEKKDNKCRPIIMKLSDPDKRTELLNLRNLKYVEDNVITKIFISPDRTKKQQDENKELVKKLKERRQNGENNIFIKNGKIVEYRPKLLINKNVDWEHCDQNDQ